jgi:hypothetical protein
MALLGAGAAVVTLMVFGWMERVDHIVTAQTLAGDADARRSQRAAS